MTILASLAQAYERLAERNEVPPFGYSRVAIGFCIVLDQEGRPAFPPVDLRSRQGTKTLGRRLNVPTAMVQRTSGIAPAFLWDKTAYSLGVTAGGGKRTAEEHAAFVDFNHRALANSDDSGLRRFLKFLEFWKPAQFTAMLWNEDMADENIVFAIEEDYKTSFLHERDEAQLIWSRILAFEKASQLACLVTGEKSRVARSHMPVKGVWDAQSSGAYIVSYNAPAFESYGKKEGDNAPISEAAAFAYTTALNRFLERDSPNRMQVGDASAVFWADAAAANSRAAVKAAEEAEAIFRALLAQSGDEAGAKREAEMMVDVSARVDERTEADKVRAVLRRIRAGRPGDLDLGLQEHVRFHVLGLSPNAARLSVRFWLDDSFGDLARRYAAHVDGMRVAPPPKDESPSIWRCLIETAALRKTENIAPNLAGDWLRSILTGHTYPLTLLATLLMRLRADKDVNALRVAILKAVLIRNFGMEVSVSFDPENDQPGYLLGRLFAAYERTQVEALPGVNATIRDKFYGAASATPRKVFTLLDRGSANHLAKLAKEKKGYAVLMDKLIGSIMEKFDPGADPFPAFLPTDQQALFAIGYYHQRSEFFRRKDAPAVLPTLESAL